MDKMTSLMNLLMEGVVQGESTKNKLIRTCNTIIFKLRSRNDNNDLKF